MMQLRENGQRDDTGNPWNGRAIGVLGQWELCSDLVVVGCVGFENSAQVDLAECDKSRSGI
jgi:hypothetical protein